jgi:hypothetical protein
MKVKKNQFKKTLKEKKSSQPRLTLLTYQVRYEINIKIFIKKN